MKQFFLKCVVMAALVAGVMLAVFLAPLPYNHDLSAILNKRDLLKDGRRNRIIFVGGSGIYSALDSEMIQKELGRPVLNVGLWAGFGITTMLHEIQPYLRAGDVVILIPEYGRIYDDYLDASRKWIFALSPVRNFQALYGNTANPARTFALDFISLIRYKLEAIPLAAREAVRLGTLDIFRTEGYVDYRKYFNANGDSSRIFPAAASPEFIRERNDNYFALASYRGQSLAALNAFCREEQEQGIATWLAFPAYPEEEYARFHEGLDEYEARLRKELACPILGSPRDFFYPYRLFTDTIHHLGIEGKRKRTERLIELIQQQESSSPERKHRTSLSHPVAYVPGRL